MFNYPTHCVLLWQQDLEKKLLVHFRRKQNEVVFNDPTNIKEITEREMAGLQCLAGYVVTSLIRKVKKTSWRLRVK